MSRRSYVRATGLFVRRANLKAQKMIHTLHTRETYRDESNGTTKSKNKLHLTIFHKRMTSWFRKNCVSRASLTKTSQKRRRGEVTSRSEAAAGCFSPIGLANMLSSRLRQLVARPGARLPVCAIDVKKENSRGLWCCFTLRILRLLLLVFGIPCTHTRPPYSHTSFLQISTNTVGRARTKSVGNEI